MEFTYIDYKKRSLFPRNKKRILGPRGSGDRTGISRLSDSHVVRHVVFKVRYKSFSGLKTLRRLQEKVLKNCSPNKNYEHTKKIL
jgi:hypothetical protein